MRIRFATLFACILACFLLLGTHVRPAKADFTCTVCVIVVHMIEAEIQEHPQDIGSFLQEKLCTYLPENYQPVCKFLVKNFEPLIIEMLKKHATPSKICNSIKWFNCNGCSMDENLLSMDDKSKEALHRLVLFQHLKEELTLKHLNAAKFANAVGGELDPKLDVDNDGYSPVHTMIRAANWRGMDCNDVDPDIRPGLLNDRNASVDSNCNGIYGADKEGRLYEDLFCHSQEAAEKSLKTVVMFGDSASSHFHIPDEWFRVQNLSKLLSGLDEFDWPQYSWATGFDDAIEGESVYLKLRKLNQCNHRGYINVGHNGHRARDFIDQVKALRQHKNDKPYLAFMAYIGNDVCKPSIDRITTDAEFKKQITDGLLELDKVAPPGSKLLTMGLVDGRILWDAMSNMTHPLGVSYATVYDFLTCTGANPCNTWLTSNKESREFTSRRAEELSMVLKQTVNEMKSSLKNVEVDYTDFPLQPALDYAHSIGLPPSVMIEKVDGFHPSDFAHRYFSKYIWEFLQKTHPDWIGVENHFNNVISERFGDQGGH